MEKDGRLISKVFDKKDRWLWVLFLASILALIFAVVSNVVNGDAEFFPINGDYQTYNIVRRMNDGQIPFREFTNYLGLGTGSLVWMASKLFGDTLVASKSAALLCCYLCTTLMIYVTLYLVTEKKALSLGLTFLLLCCAYASVKLQVKPIDALLGGFSFRYCFEPANSLGPVRIVCATFAICLLYGGMQLIKKDGQKTSWIAPVLFGGVMGLFRLYSNDCGLAYIAAAVFCYIVVSFRWKKDFLCEILLIIAGYICMHVTAGMILTAGHYGDWWEFNSIFGSVGSYQHWYYDVAKSKLFTISYIIITFLRQPASGWLLTLAALYYLVRAFLGRKQNESFAERMRRIYLPMLLLSVLFAGWVYRIGSTNSDRYGFATNALLFGLFLGNLAKGVRLQVKAGWKLAATALVLAATAFCFYFGVRNCCLAHMHTDDKNYVTELGGVTEKAEDIRRYAAITDDKKVFSTYASALENVTNRFQPTGTDYIIHAMGDSNREKYMAFFQSYDADYVTTFNMNYSAWECWIMRANWFFYRQMLQTYEPYDADGYLVLWNKADHQLARVDLCDKLQAGVQDNMIWITAGEGAPNCIADVQVQYSVRSTSRLAALNTLCYEVAVEDGWSDIGLALGAIDTYSLPAEDGVAQKTNIPIYINAEEGGGFAYLIPYPERVTDIIIESVTIDTVFPAYDCLSPEVLAEKLLQPEMGNKE